MEISLVARKHLQLVTLVLLTSACSSNDNQGADSRGAAFGDASSANEQVLSGTENIDSCGYTRTDRLVCRKDTHVTTTSTNAGCVENERACEKHAEPSGEKDSGDCYTNWITTWVAFKGSCADWDAFKKGERECLVNDNCPAQGTCIHFKCDCGAEPCPKPGPPPPGPDGGAQATKDQGGGTQVADKGTGPLPAKDSGSTPPPPPKDAGSTPPAPDKGVGPTPPPPPS